MFERFTRDARVAVTAAVTESERRGERHVGTDHLLLGVITAGGPVTSAALAAAGMDLQAARRVWDEADLTALAAIGVDVHRLPGPSGTAQRPRLRWLGRSAHRPFTGGAKRALEGALREALAREDRHIGSEHLLLALADRPAPDPARHLLTALDVEPADLRTDLERRLRDAA
ncbi:MAG TPA: Clp protease N-terminal domain-containing protein [Euzebyales bacterium]|nr:Clp protease N-terminal domain-containing protein [Euzebyales bacterium]